MKPETIFLVKASYSSWDSHHVRTLKAFYNDNDAQAYVSKATRILEAMSNHVSEVFKMNSHRFESDFDWEAYEQTPEYQKALDIWAAHNEFEEFNRCFIEKVEIR